MTKRAGKTVYFSGEEGCNLLTWAEEHVRDFRFKSFSNYLLHLIEEDRKRQSSAELPSQGRVTASLDSMKRTIDELRETVLELKTEMKNAPVVTTVLATEPTTGNVQPINAVSSKKIDLGSLDTGWDE